MEERDTQKMEDRRKERRAEEGRAQEREGSSGCLVSVAETRACASCVVKRSKELIIVNYQSSQLLEKK